MAHSSTRTPEERAAMFEGLLGSAGGRMKKSARKKTDESRRKFESGEEKASKPNTFVTDDSDDIEVPKIPIGAIDVQTGQFYPGVGGGIINPQTGQFYPDVGGGYINPQTGQFMPKF